MTRTVANALKSLAVLVCISVVCVALLAVCNMFFPKYTPTLDGATAALVNSICPTGKSDAEAFDDGYIVMLSETDCGVSLAEYNKANKSAKAQILAIYGEPKGDNAGTYVIECSAKGRDGDVVLLIAYKDAAIVGAAVKKQNESYFAKLPDDLFDTVKGESGNVDLVGEIGKTGATVTLSAINRAVNFSNAFAIEYNSKIGIALAKSANEGGEA